jgi:hypothetical protein
VTHLALGASAAVVALSLLATGDLLLVAVLLAVAVADVAAGPAAVLATAASLVRWGTPSLGGVGADQAVLGIAGAVGPPLAAASAWLGAASLVVLPHRVPVAALASGSLAALLVAGPTDAGGWWIRVLATVAAVGVAVWSARVLDRRHAAVASVTLAGAALALAVVA